MPYPYTNLSLIQRQAQRSELDLDALTAWVQKGGGKRIPDFDQYAGTLLAGCLRLGIDPFVLLGQWHLEAGGGTSSWWGSNLNPGGIGVVGEVGGTSDGTGSQIWATGLDAAFGHLAHVAAYLYGEDVVDYWPDDWPDLIVADQRFMAPIRAGYKATNLLSLGRQRFTDGKWRGWSDNDPEYGTKLAARANMIYEAAGKETAPVANVYGKVPHPAYDRHLIRKDPNHGVTYIDGTRGRPVGCIHHEWMDGGEEGEEFYEDFFECPSGIRHKDACVDYFIMRSGKIVMINDPEGNRIPWASGGSGPYQGDGGAFVRRFGASAVNRRLVSWEYCKRNNDNLTAAQIQSGGLLAAYWHDRDEQPWDQHPYVPKYGCVTSLLHHEVSGTDCGLDMYDDISKVQEVTKAQMKKYQTATDPAPPPEPVYAERHPLTAGTQTINNRLYLAIAENYTLTKNATPREWAEPTSDPTGPDLKKGAVVQTSHVVKDEGIESNLTLVLVNGDRIPAAAVA